MTARFWLPSHLQSCTLQSRVFWKWKTDRVTYLLKILHCALIAQSCLTLCDPVDCSPPASSVHGISQARILEWIAISFSRESFQPRDQTRLSCVFCIAGGFFTLSVIREVVFYSQQVFKNFVFLKIKRTKSKYWSESCVMASCAV